VITVPATGDRYFVIQLVDTGTDNFAYIGPRATGRDGCDRGGAHRGRRRSAVDLPTITYNPPEGA
jgi:Protein of unknown function (DUF1254)